MLTINATVQAACSTKLREHFRVAVQNLVDEIRLEERCPDSPNIILTNTSGSLRIEENKVILPVVHA